MKFISILFALLISEAVSAAVQVSLVPADPWVNLADLNQNPGTPELLKAKAPWFQAAYSVKNDSKIPVEVSSVLITAVSLEGRKISKTIPVSGVKLEAGEEKAIGPFFIEGLPNSETLVYSVTAAIQYQSGEAAESSIIQFKTR